MLAVVVVAVIGVFLGLGLTSEYALYTAAADGLKAGIVLAGPVLGGLWLVPLFRLGRLPWRWHLLLGATLGTGATSLLVLLLGL
ncbi:MAG: hypothetical protein ACE5HE_01535, partial [Phycisphaerae bacterium]